jgi:hypothetical protein
MNKADTIQEEDVPLDPAMERVRRKMVRLLMISIGVMMAGVMAVLFGIVYKVNHKSAVPVSASQFNIPQGTDEITGIIALPAGAHINGHSFSGNQIVIDMTLRDGKREMTVFDMGQGRIIAHYTLTNLK